MKKTFNEISHLINSHYSIGYHISSTQYVDSIDRMFELSKYTQKWADMLNVPYWDINDLPMSGDETMTVEQRIDMTIKEKMPDAFMKIDVMAKVLGAKK